MKKQKILTGMLFVALLMPVSEAKAQGWPTFDVAKLASLITNLIGRFQPVPQVLSRVNQVKSTISQIQAVGQAVVSGDLKSLGKAAMAGLQTSSFSKGFSVSSIESAAKGSNGASDSSKAIKDSFFSLKSDKVGDVEVFKEQQKVRKEYRKKVLSEMLSKAIYLSTNAATLSQERFEKADKAMKNAETIQDSINANTMMIMAGNYERLNLISLELAKTKKNLVGVLFGMPVSGYIKPTPVKNIKMGDVKYSDEEKDEIDVDL